MIPASVKACATRATCATVIPFSIKASSRSEATSRPPVTAMQPDSASRAHSLANVRMTPEQMVEEVRRCVELRSQLRGKTGPEIEAGVATAFGCTMQGEVPEDDVVRIAGMLAEAGVDCIALADTVGYANPAQIKRLFSKVRKVIGSKLEAAHLHDTRGLGLANALAAYEEGVRAFDSSMGGLGGCPFAPGEIGRAHV